jgi:hypothetical protein
MTERYRKRLINTLILGRVKNGHTALEKYI